MRVEIITIKELSDSLKQKWLSFQVSNPSLSGPSFHPDLFIAAGQFFPDIYVALLHNRSELMGFLPFRKDEKWSLAKQIEFCYYQAIISPSHQYWDIGKILRESGLKKWDFLALVDFGNIKSKQGCFKPSNIPCVDLRGGFDKYLDCLKEKNISFKNLMYKEKLLSRDIGPVRFVPVCNDVEVLHKVLSWKVIRYEHNADWLRSATALLEYLFFPRNNYYPGILSALYAGDKVLASIFNLRYQGIMQFYVTSFDPSFSRYSPGLLSLYYLILELPNLQCNILDFGGGGEKYKLDFSNSSTPVLNGYFKRDSLKERIKSVNWLHRGLRPIVRAGRKVKKSIKSANI